MNKKKEVNQTNYKLATIVISILSVIVILGQTVYTGFFNKRWNEIEHLEGQKSELKTELKELEALPKII